LLKGRVAVVVPPLFVFGGEDLIRLDGWLITGVPGLS